MKTYADSVYEGKISKRFSARISKNLFIFHMNSFIVHFVDSTYFFNMEILSETAEKKLKDGPKIHLEFRNSLQEPTKPTVCQNGSAEPTRTDLSVHH